MMKNNIHAIRTEVLMGHELEFIYTAEVLTTAERHYLIYMVSTNQ